MIGVARSVGDERLDLLTLSLADGLTPRQAAVLLSRGPLSGALERPDEHRDVLSAATQKDISSLAALRRAEDQALRCAAEGVSIVALCDPAYPPALLQIHDPPPVLFVRGALETFHSPLQVALVGTRGASPQGRALARRMARDLGAAGCGIVSGLARGIDTCAHEGALAASSPTLAVLGSGLDRVYPGENMDLALRVARTGALVSEFPLGTQPRPHNFPRRNRIIAGLVPVVVVVEAPLRSGALVTARLALDCGREVLAVPGHPSHASFAGTNALIRDGATLVRDAADVAEVLGCRIPEQRPRTDASSPCPVRQVLTSGVPFGVEEIAERTRLPPPEILSRLAGLELRGEVSRLPGALFVRS